MKPSSNRRSLVCSVLAGPCLLPLTASAQALETPPSKLDEMIVSALRTPREASTVTSSVTVLDPAELQNQGIRQIRDALNAAPGVISTSTGGQTGAVGSLFIRGTKTADSQIVIDGVRLSDSNSPMGSLLASGRTFDTGSIEVLRGPQGAIYGGESIGGVLWMSTPAGSGKPHGSTSLEGGSFGTFSGNSIFQGQTKALSYYLSGGYEQSDNDGPDQAFHQGNTALRVEGLIDPAWTIGTTFRSVDAFYENAGGFGSAKGSDDHFDSALATIYATGRISDRWTSRFTVGYHQEAYDSDYLDFSKNPTNYGTDLEAASISTDQEITLAENLRLLAGAFYHHDSYTVTDGVDETGDRYGAHTALEWDVLENLTTTAALRWEDYDSFGDEVTWRLGSIYNLEKTGTSFRAGVGRSFRAPSYTDLYYNSAWYVANPDLDAQSSIGWDVGVAQKIGKRHTIEATWFRNDIDDAIDSYSDPDGDFVYTATNLSGTTTTDGLELALRGDWLESALAYRLAWTYLHESLSGQPTNAVTAALDWKPTAKGLVGIGATHLSDHSWGGEPINSYTLVRLHGSYQVTGAVKLHARVENVFDANYELSRFGGTNIQGSGTGVYAGITVDW